MAKPSYRKKCCRLVLETGGDKLRLFTPSATGKRMLGQAYLSSDGKQINYFLLSLIWPEIAVLTIVTFCDLQNLKNAAQLKC